MIINLSKEEKSSRTGFNIAILLDIILNKDEKIMCRICGRELGKGDIVYFCDENGIMFCCTECTKRGNVNYNVKIPELFYDYVSAVGKDSVSVGIGYINSVKVMDNV